MTQPDNHVQLVVEHLPPVVAKMFTDLAESAGMSRSAALQCLLWDFFDNCPKVKGVPAHPLYPYWKDHHQTLVQSFSGQGVRTVVP